MGKLTEAERCKRIFRRDHTKIVRALFEAVRILKLDADSPEAWRHVKDIYSNTEPWITKFEPQALSQQFFNVFLPDFYTRDVKSALNVDEIALCTSSSFKIS